MYLLHDNGYVLIKKTQKLKSRSMKTLFVLFLTLSTGLAFANGPVKVDVKNSTLEWKAAKVTGEHMGTVDLKSAELNIENGVLKGGSFVVDMTTINVTDLEGEWKAKLEGHLKSDDFFSVANHQTAEFKTTKVKSLGGNKYMVQGDLTIKGMTHPIGFETTVANGNATATLKIDRTLYDVRYRSGKFFEGLGDNLIYDEFEIAVNLTY